jgi:hypothetical protein
MRMRRENRVCVCTSAGCPIAGGGEGDEAMTFRVVTAGAGFLNKHQSLTPAQGNGTLAVAGDILETLFQRQHFLR